MSSVVVDICLLPPANEVWGKVCFHLRLSFSPLGGSLSLIPCSFQGGLCPGGFLFRGSLSEGVCPGAFSVPQYSKERTIRILLECILVFIIKLDCYFKCTRN